MPEKRDRYDRSSKWLLEVEVSDEVESALVLVEIATYSEPRVVEQARDGMAAVLLDRGRLPDVLTIILRPKGRYRVPESASISSTLGCSELSFQWRVVELWKVDAEALLASGDVGLIPWVPLAKLNRPAREVVAECRRRIDESTPKSKQNDLLSVMQVLLSLRFRDRRLFQLLGGKRAMIESPLIDELVDERYGDQMRRELAERKRQFAEELAEQVAEQVEQELRNSVVAILKVRFRSVTDETLAALANIDDENKLRGLLEHSAVCNSPEEFLARLSAGV